MVRAAAVILALALVAPAWAEWVTVCRYHTVVINGTRILVAVDCRREWR